MFAHLALVCGGAQDRETRNKGESIMGTAQLAGEREFVMVDVGESGRKAGSTDGTTATTGALR